jgi:hypothetical protein
VQVHATKEDLILGAKLETCVTLDRPPALTFLGDLLEVIGEVRPRYKLWPVSIFTVNSIFGPAADQVHVNRQGQLLDALLGVGGSIPDGW